MTNPHQLDALDVVFGGAVVAVAALAGYHWPLPRAQLASGEVCVWGLPLGLGSWSDACDPQTERRAREGNAAAAAGGVVALLSAALGVGLRPSRALR